MCLLDQNFDETAFCYSALNIIWTRLIGRLKLWGKIKDIFEFLVSVQYFKIVQVYLFKIRKYIGVFVIIF